MTRLESVAWTGFNNYWSELSAIWIVYKRYGEVVLEKDLEEGDENIKNLFTQSKGDDLRFAENVLNYWRKNYHIVINNYEELSKLFCYREEHDKREFTICLLPDSEKYQKGEKRGNECNYSISEEFYHQVIADIKLSKRKELLLVVPNRDIIGIFSEIDYGVTTFKSIKISNEMKVIYL